MKKCDRGYFLEFPSLTSRLTLTWTWKNRPWQWITE